MVDVLVNNPVSDEDRRTAIFHGDLLLTSKTAASSALVHHARSMIEDAFGELDPERAQFSLAVADFVAIVGPLKSRFTNDAHTKELIRALLVELDVDIERTFFDVPRLRVVPHGDYLSSGVSYAYRPHRDTWYSSPLCQLNWWIPVFRVVPTRAMTFFPSYFDRAAENSSASFDYDEWCRVGRPMALSQVGRDTRNHPVPVGEINRDSALRIGGAAGDLLQFSAMHLHETAPNESGCTRFSLDFRTLALDDLEQRRGPVDHDTASTGTTLGDFLRASDFATGLLPIRHDG